MGPGGRTQKSGVLTLKAGKPDKQKDVERIIGRTPSDELIPDATKLVYGATLTFVSTANAMQNDAKARVDGRVSAVRL